MTRSATLPPIRVTPETKQQVESVLRDGESMTEFIERAVRHEAEWRREQNAAMERADEAMRDAAAGVGLVPLDELLQNMDERAAKAKRRIRSAFAAGKRSGVA